MIVAIVQFRFPAPISVSDAEVAFGASAPAYQRVPGLIRKHYLLAEDGTVGGGVYLWEDKASAEALYDAAWRARLADRYGAEPTVTYYLSPVSVDAESIAIG